jgi:hypothetical protein
LRGTVASGAKQREKVIPKARVETKALSVQRGGKRSARRLEVARETKGYQQLTKAAKAKATPRTYVLEGLRVEVPMIVVEEYVDSIEEQQARIERMIDEEAQGPLEAEKLFVGRHTYCDAEGQVVEERLPWMELMMENIGVNFELRRYCRARNIPYPLEDDEDDE